MLYSMYDRLRKDDPVHYSEAHGGWLLLRYGDVKTAMVDPRLSAARTRSLMADLSTELEGGFPQFTSVRDDMLLFLDGPKHATIRRAFVAAMRTAAGDRAAGRIATLTEELLDGFSTQSRVDVIGEFARPLPLLVLVDVLGAPVEDAPRIGEWATAFSQAISTPVLGSRIRVAEQAIEELRSYLSRPEGGSGQKGVLGVLRSHVISGRITEGELLASVLAFISAGHGTATDLIGNGLSALSRYPTELGWLRERPERTPAIIDELLRFESPVQLTRREARASFMLHGRPITVGQRVIPVFGAANRDPVVFEDPERLWLARLDAHRQLGFGSGAHRCPGAALARLEATLAISAFLARFKELSAVEADVWRNSDSFRGLERLMLTVSAA